MKLASSCFVFAFGLAALCRSDDTLNNQQPSASYTYFSRFRVINNQPASQPIVSNKSTDDKQPSATKGSQFTKLAELKLPAITSKTILLGIFRRLPRLAPFGDHLSANQQALYYGASIEREYPDSLSVFVAS